MERVVVVTEAPIAEVLAGAERNEAAGATLLTTTIGAGGADGAWLDFYGLVRDTEPDGAVITAIDYEAHVAMAVHQIHRILDRLEARYPLSAVALVHRIGPVPVGVPSLLVRILAPHRGEALAACALLIDELKRDVPIWKHPQ